MMTDPQAPRHRNLGYFLIPVPSPGLEIREMNLVHGHEQHFIFMDKVRVPGNNLIGGDHQGWQVTNTTLEQEHGGRGMPITNDEQVDNMVHYMQEKQEQRRGPGGDPVIQQVAVDSIIDARVNSLLQKRNYWMYQNHREMSWEGSMTSIVGRLQRLDHTRRARDVMGMYTLLGTQEPRALFGGSPEVDQRGTFASGFGAGGLTITKVIVARRIGISRTQERAAPTPSTATKLGS
jgi:alkylation response protein AidB-like acyl-CoA dehydrogenase